MPAVVKGSRKNWSARQRIEHAFHVSFMLPEQAGSLLDEYRAEVRAEMLEEVLAIVASVKDPRETERNWHWFSFARNRVADTLRDLLS